MVASMVDKGGTVADIGCDHAYVSIYLMEQKIATKVIAMDVRTGPLDIAKKNIYAHGLADKIEIRLSDGLEKLSKDEVGTVVIAGIGGQLIIDIIDRGKEILGNGDLVLQPQSELGLVREKIHNLGYSIIDENIVIDQDKYYTVIKCRKLENTKKANYNKADIKYGKILLDNKNEVLLSFLHKEKSSYENVLNTLKKSNSESATRRIMDIEEEMDILKEALKYYDM